MKLSIATLVQGMTDQRVNSNTDRAHWFTFWRFLSVVIRNGKPVITNRPY